MPRLKYKLLFLYIWFFKKSKFLSSLACQLTKITGKNKYPLHPKHLVNKQNDWYLKNINKKDIILDLGCGNGSKSLKIARRCKNVFAVDNNIKQLTIFRRLLKDKNIKNVRIIKFNLEKKLPFENNYFNKILCIDLLEHLHKRGQLLKEINRVLKKNSLVYLAVPNSETSWKKLQKKSHFNYFTDPDHKIEYTYEQIINLLKKHRFDVKNIKPIVYDTPWAGFIDLIGGVSLSLYEKVISWKREKVKNNIKESTGFKIIIQKKNFI